MDNDLELALILLTAGFFLLWAGRRVRMHFLGMHACCTETVTATVVEVTEKNASLEEDASAMNYFPVFEYESGGRTYRTKERYTLMNPIAVGEKYSIHIDPKNPEHAALSISGKNIATFALNLFGLFMVIPAVILLFSSLYGMYGGL